MLRGCSCNLKTPNSPPLPGRDLASDFSNIFFLALIRIISLRALERHLAYFCATLVSGDDRGVIFTPLAPRVRLEPAAERAAPGGGGKF